MKVPLALAGVSLVIEVDELRRLGPRKDRFVPFMSRPGKDSVSLTVHPVERPCFRPVSHGELDTRWYHTGTRLNFDSNFERAHVCLEKRIGDIWVCPGGTIENFLRVLVALECLSTGGLFLHASGVMTRNKSYVFFGHSGSGKSTIAKIAPNGDILGDDVVVVRRGADGLRAYSLPFGHLPGKANFSAPVAGLFRLRKASRHTIRNVSMARGVAELLSCSPFVHNDVALQRQALETAHALATSVPVQELWFYPDSSVWSFLTGDNVKRGLAGNVKGRAIGTPGLNPIPRVLAAQR